MTNDEAINLINKLFLKANFTDEYGDMEDTESYEEAIKTVTEVLKQDSCEDCISRQAAINAIFAEPLYKPGMKKRYAEEAMPAIFEKIKALPPVTPQLKIGRWIIVDKGLIVTSYKCSECGKTVRDDTGYNVTKDYPYCHCGAKMQEMEESGNK